MFDVEGNLRGIVLLETFVHQDERATDYHHRGQDSDDQANLLPRRCGADKIACLEILRGVPRIGGGNAHHASDGQRQRRVSPAGPVRQQEHRAGGHQRGDSHPADGIGGGADQPGNA